MKDDEILDMFCSAASKKTGDEWEFGPAAYGGFACSVNGVIVLRAETLGKLTANLVKSMSMSNQDEDRRDFDLGQLFLPKIPALDGVTSKEDLALRLSCII